MEDKTVVLEFLCPVRHRLFSWYFWEKLTFLSVLKRLSVARSSVLRVSAKDKSNSWDGRCSPFPGIVGAGRTIRALGFGARMCVSAPLNSPEELLTWERVPYTESLGKDTAISDCNNSQTDFWEQTVIRTWSLPPRAICSSHCRKKQQLSPMWVCDL